jgi:hypothetical protein
MGQYNIRLKTGLQTENCTVSAFSFLAAPPITSKRYSQQQISQLIAGTREFESEQEATEFLGVIESMRSLQEIVQPRVPIDWTNVAAIKDVLAQHHERRKDELDPIHNRCWFVRLTVHDFFKGLRSDDTEIRTLNYYNGDAAAFTSYELASEVANKLKQRGVATKLEVLTCQRRQSTITTSLEEIGFMTKENQNV